MTVFVLWAVFIAFFLLVVVAAITQAVVRRTRRGPRGPFRRSARE